MNTGLGQLLVVWAILFGLLLLILGQSAPSDSGIETSFGQFLVELERNDVRAVGVRTRDDIPGLLRAIARLA